MDVVTYSAKDVILTFGEDTITGYADDSFVSIEPNGDGISKKVGCDGEVARAISPDRTYKIKIVLMQTSPSNEVLQKAFAKDRVDRKGVKQLTVEDAVGGFLFSAPAWIVRSTSYSFGKDVGNREWQFDTAQADNGTDY